MRSQTNIEDLPTSVASGTAVAQVLEIVCLDFHKARDANRTVGPVTDITFDEEGATVLAEGAILWGCAVELRCQWIRAFTYEIDPVGAGSVVVLRGLADLAHYRCRFNRLVSWGTERGRGRF
jgi:hypothetical protein